MRKFERSAAAAAAAVLACLALAGCAQPPEVDSALKTTAARESRISASLARATQLGNELPSSVLRVEKNRPYVGLETLSHGHRLPERLRAKNGITVPRGAWSTTELARTLTEIAGIPVTVSGVPPIQEEPFTLPDKDSAGLVDSSEWTGPLDAFLDTIADRYGYAWYFDRGRVVIIRRKTAVIRFAMSSLKRPYQGEVSADNSSSGSQGVASSSSQSLHVEGEDYRWDEIVKSLKTAAGEGVVLSASPNSGTITVSGLPRAVDHLKVLAKDANDSYLRPVNLAVRFVRVDRRKSADYRFDLAGALGNAAREVGLTFKGDGAGGVLGVVKHAGSAPRDSLNATIRALNIAGTVSRNTGFGVMGSNRRPSAFNDLEMQTYVASTSSNVTGDTSRSDLNVKAINAGVQLSYTPSVIDYDTVALDLDLTIQDRPAFEDYETSGVTVQRITSYKSRSISVPLILDVGDVAVLNGFADSQTDSEQRGTGAASNWLFGGSSKAGRDDSAHVILVSVSMPPAPKLRIRDLVEAEF